MSSDPGPTRPVDVRAMTPDPTRVVLRRAGAFVVDGLLVVLIVLFAIWVSGAVETAPGPCPDPIPEGRSCVAYRGSYFMADNWSFLVFGILLLAAFLAVFGLVPGVTGASPGKSLFGIRVARRDGSDAGWRRGLVRALAWAVDALVLLIPIALWGALFSPGHRRVGDFVAGTFVVRARAVPAPTRRWARAGRRRISAAAPAPTEGRRPPPSPG